MFKRWIDSVRDWRALKLVFVGIGVVVIVSEMVAAGTSLLLGEGVPFVVIISAFFASLAAGLPLMSIVARFVERLRTADDALREGEEHYQALFDQVGAATVDLSRAVQAKDEFLADMSHELRTPLHALLGLSQALREGVYGPLNRRQLQSLRNIEKSGHHLLVLINGVLDVAAIGAGQLELRVAPVSVASVCEDSLEMVKPAARKKRLQVVSTYDNTVETVQADGLRLKQILVHLLGNGVKFASEGGTVGLEVVGDAEQEVVHFTVWDTGVGITEEEMGRLFQPFVQLDAGLPHRDGGMGLGLALVRQLTEMHGGGISVMSEIGKGSRFTVSLPWWPGWEGGRTEEESTRITEQGPEPAAIGCQSPAVILVAEDNDANLRFVWDYLLAKGYEVIVARNGVEAIARVREKRPDLILMDIQMPVMDGLEATRRIRADAGLEGIPIVALTALARPGDRERCVGAGVDEYLSKPVSLKWLAQTIETQLGGSRMAGCHGPVRERVVEGDYVCPD